MLKVSIHAGSLATAKRGNLLAWADIGYEKLEPVADYKTLLFQAGIGATMPTPIYKYPRWSASLWDLVARALALGLREDEDCLNEEVPPVIRERKRFAFAGEVCATIEHLPLATTERRTLGTAEIKQAGRVRGKYIARFSEHTMPEHVTQPFEYCPDVFQPAELLLRSSLIRLSGEQTMPPRPALCVPTPISFNNEAYVPIHRLVEPARTGFVSWLLRQNQQPIEHAQAPQGIASTQLYIKFLTEAV